MKKNADFQYKAGLRPRIICDDAYGCCEWCSRIAGTYNYPNVPKDVFKRHENCRCTVDYDPAAGKRIQDVWTKRSTIKEDSGKIEKRKEIGLERDITGNRNLAMGLRKPPSHILTDDEIENIKADARSIKVPENILRFNEGSRTGFNERLGLIYVRGDVLPDTASMIARDKMSSRAVLAHEYYGHVKNSPSEYEPSDWRDEFRASYDAAINTPNLTEEERKDLMVDAYDRAREAGHPEQYDKKARKIIYGY